jgi:alpha-L-fucosidase
MTMNDHWGYNKNDQDWKSARMLVRNLIDCASKGGNYLLNVGPTSQGLIPAPSLERLKQIGDWMNVNGESIYGTTASPFNKRPSWGRCTTKVSGRTTTLYLHVFNWPANGQLLVSGFKNKIQKAWLLADKSRHKLAVKNSDDGITLALPAVAADPISTTVVLRIKGPLVIQPQPEPKATASNVYQNQTDDYGPQFAFDDEDQTRWATDDATKQVWIAVDLPKSGTFLGVHISEAYAGRVQKFEFQYLEDGDWKTIFLGTTVGENFNREFDAVTAKEFRLNILDATQGPTINEIKLVPK